MADTATPPSRLSPDAQIFCKSLQAHLGRSFPTSFQWIPKRHDFSLGSPMIPPDPVLWASGRITRVFISDVCFFSKPTAQSNPNQQLALVIKMIEVNRSAGSRRWQRRALPELRQRAEADEIQTSSRVQRDRNSAQLYRTPASASKEAGHTEFVIDVCFFLTIGQLALDPLVVM